MALLGRLSETHVVIAALCFTLIFAIFLLVVTRGLFKRLGITKIYKVPIPLFLSLSFFVLLIFSSLSSHPLVCQSCHPMRAPTQGLQASSHKGVACLSCHKKSVTMALPIQKLEQARMTLNYLRGNYKQPIQAVVDDGACVSCHKDDIRGVKARFKVKMSHQEVIDGDISCIECHEGIAHKKKALKKPISMMEKCSACHNDEEASSRCQTCHFGNVRLGMKPDEGWRINHDENWPKTHGSRSLYVCKACHYEKDCNRCHSTVPHAEGWAFIHGQEAKNNPSDCKICHKKENFCVGCHRIAMPHPAGWTTRHRWEAKAIDTEICTSCHYPRDCEQCHEQHASTPGVRKK